MGVLILENEYYIPEDRLYTETHEWVKMENGIVIVGITDYAQKMLHDIVYIELPELGKNIKRGDVIAEIESVKSVAELYSPATGRIIEVNIILDDKPEMINRSPYEDGWIVKISPENWDEDKEKLLSAEEYIKLIREEEDVQRGGGSIGLLYRYNSMD